MSFDTKFTQAKGTADFIRSKLNQELKFPQVGIICGSGLGGLHESLEPTPQVSIPYSEIPGFLLSTGIIIQLYKEYLADWLKLSAGSRR